MKQFTINSNEEKIENLIKYLLGFLLVLLRVLKINTLITFVKKTESYVASANVLNNINDFFNNKVVIFYSGILFLVFGTFTFTLMKHMSVLYYIISIIIFVFYLPNFYSFSRSKIKKRSYLWEKLDCEHGFCKLRYYPIEFFIWFTLTIFFSYMLAHLSADIFDGLDDDIHYLTHPFIFISIIIIVYREIKDKKIDDRFEKRENYIKQGWWITFQILSIFLIIFFSLH